MSHLTRPRVLVIVGAALVSVASAVAVLLGGMGPPLLVVRSVSGATFIAAGAVVWSRGGPRRMGTLFVLAGCALCSLNLTLLPGPIAAAVRLGAGGYAPFGTILAHLLLAYPTGRLRSQYDRVVIGVFYAATGLYMISQLVIGTSSGERFCPVGCDGVFAPAIRSDRADVFAAHAVLIIFPTLIVLSLVSVLRTFWSSGPGERRALRPLLVSVAAAAGLGVTSSLLAGLQTSSGTLLRTAIAVVWGVAVAGIAVSLLAGVLRNRLMLYGMGNLVSRLGSDDPVQELQGVLARLLRDPTVQLVRVDARSGGFCDLNGSPVDYPGRDRAWLLIGDPVSAAVVYDPAAQPDPRLVEGIIGALRLVFENLRLQEQLSQQLVEVQASRSRIVAAGDAERRRVERNLHDGAQQHLVGAALNVRRARRQLSVDPAAADQLLLGVEDQLRTALAEIRDLARGLYPPVLTEEGLGPAVAALADRLPLRVRIEDTLTRRYREPVEAAAYFAVCEALVNVGKHADTESAVVSLRTAGNGTGGNDTAGNDTDGSDLVVIVTDHGRGGADPASGSGLPGLADRVAALGGALGVVSQPGHGTTVRVVLPAGDRPALEGSVGQT